jgi:hypothetical protein
VQNGLVARSSKVTQSEGLPAATHRGGPLLADCGVVRRSLYIGPQLVFTQALTGAPSLLLAFGQNRLRQGGAN